MKKVVSFFLLIISLLNLVSCGLLKNSLEDFFSDWEPEEKDDEIAIINAYFDSTEIMLLCGEKEVDIKPFLTEEVFFHPGECLAFVGGKLYFYNNFIINENQRGINIYAIDFENEDITCLYEENYDLYIEDSYEKTEYNNVRLRYYDRNIFIYDEKGNVRKLSTDTNKCENFTDSDISKFIPAPEYKVELIEDEGKTGNFNEIKITKGEEYRIINIEYMAERNKYANLLYNLDDNMLPLEVEPLKSFFRSAVVVGDNIYIECIVFDEDGERNYVLFSYNYKMDVFKFLYHYFSTGVPDIKCVPAESK